jgi:predicted extracellular nuclease
MKIRLATVARTLILVSLAAGTAYAPPALAASAGVVISQVYGGGGNTGATLTHDFIELFNRGTAAVSLSGWSVQYASATGTGNFGSSATQITELSAVFLAPGQYLLIQEAAGAGGTTPLPSPDVTDSSPILMSATAGKVALVNSTAPLGCNGGSTPCPPAALAMIVDLVGYGGANFFEGAGATPALNNTSAGLRSGGGCVDTDNNASDFSVGTPTPRNTGSPLNPCPGNPVIAVCDGPLSTDEGVATSAPVRASDADGAVVNMVVTSVTPSPAPGTISLINPIPAGGVGGTATADVDVDTAVPAGTYAVLITATNADPTPQSGTCTLTVIVRPQVISIHDIQGAGHISPKAGTLVATGGIVTALRLSSGRGFYLQDPAPDVDDATSEGIFVFTSIAPSVAVGDQVMVIGTVAEFRPGGSGSANLTTTEITSPSIALLSTGNPLPSPTVIGAGGHVPPATVIEDDAGGNVETGGTFDPPSDGIDFYESLEAMLVQVNNAVAVGPRNSFGEIPVVADDGASAGLRTGRGGIVIRSNDFNPERIIIDDVLMATPLVDVGDHFTAPVVGVMDYDFGNFKLLTTGALISSAGGLTQETAAAPASHQLAVAAFNVENLDPADGAAKFDELASLIVDNLRSPDILAVEEIQDNNGPTNDSGTDASLTYGMLISAIQAVGGPTYDFRQIDPVDDQDGGEPGGNIRVGFLFRTDRGLTFIDRPGGTPTSATTVVNGTDGPELSASPGRIDPTNSAFTTSRKPLAGEFAFRGDRVFVVANHFNSKGGDQPLFGRFQPPTLVSEVQRLQQAQIVHDFVEDILALNSQANVIVLGDLNDFEFSAPLLTLKGNILEALIETLPEGERYTYVFDGNSQVLDHILLSSSFFGRPFGYDVVHVNSEFADQASDHEPQVVHLSFAPSLDQLEGLLDFYANTGEIAGNNTLKNLRGHLDTARDALAEGNQSKYAAQLQAFANQVRGYSPQFVTPEAAEALAAEAELLGDQG